jgi:predicted SnoaL-like aldol condensation-catalyzing enzyme
VSGRRESEGQAFAEELRGLGADATFIRADVRKEDDVRALVDQTIGLPPRTSSVSRWAPKRKVEAMSRNTEQEARNKSLVLKAFDTLFNRRDYAAAAEYWSPRYVQHSAHIPPGREGLFDLVKSTPPTMRYENALVVAEGDYVMLHGRFSGIGQPAAWVVADIVRVEDGRLAEHWDVIQDEATREQSKSGHPMFGSSFPS